jgi:hypothetical protein
MIIFLVEAELFHEATSKNLMLTKYVESIQHLPKNDDDDDNNSSNNNNNNNINNNLYHIYNASKKKFS